MKKSAKPLRKTEFSPRIFHAKPADWLSVAGIMILGALIGLIVSFFLPPKYEAVSKLTTNLEVVTGTNVTEIMVDAQVDIVGTLVFHPDVIERVRLSLAEQNMTYTATELIRKTKIERQLMSTLIKVRDNDPEVATLIATTWAEKAYERLNEAYPHALALSQAKASQTMLTGCLEDTSKQNLPFCETLTSEKTDQLLKETEGIILQESSLSLGLTGELNISQYQPAPVPDSPIAFQRSILILAGALAGLVFALLLGELLSKDQDRE
jgi:uncharacterized protein involved in exopolysaccharide biosynthesis